MNWTEVFKPRTLRTLAHTAIVVYFLRKSIGGTPSAISNDLGYSRKTEGFCNYAF